MFVMSTHGRSALGRLIVGRVAESVLRGTIVPILIVRAASASRRALGRSVGEDRIPVSAKK
jgi:hypothetical protein